ncbi:MAG TPA: glycosyltransferase [Caulobacteraceae bacterium]
MGSRGAGAAPLVSVIIPCFNEDAGVIEASFASLRAQTLTNFECIVVDEGSDEEKARACRAACARDPRFSYLRPAARGGIAASLNLAIAQARGAYIARADGDDLCDGDRLRAQAAFLGSRPEIGVLGCAVRVIDGNGRPTAHRRYPLKHGQIARCMRLTNAMAHPTVMLRREVFERHGLYDPEFRYCEDLELWLRLIRAGVRFANLSEPLVSYRQEATSRPAAHWRDNLRARAKTLWGPNLALGLLGFVGIAAWSVMPRGLRRLAYGHLIYTRAAGRNQSRSRQQRAPSPGQGKAS